MQRPFQVEVVHVDGGATIALIGELDIDSRGELGAVQALASRYDLGQVTFSCAELAFIDAAGLDALIAALRWFGPDGKPRLAEPSASLRTLLEVTNTDVLFELIS